MKWSICKSFEFDYAHRVWTQTLNTELSLTSCLKCRRPHGHRGTVWVHVSGNRLDERGMILDFNELTFFKKFIDDVLDHKCILDYQDPSIPVFFPLLKDIHNYKIVNFDLETFDFHNDGYFSTIQSKLIENLPDYEREVYEGLVLVPFIPTSENLAKWLFEIVQRKLEGYGTVKKVEFYETPKSCSTYYGS